MNRLVAIVDSALDLVANKRAEDIVLIVDLSTELRRCVFWRLSLSTLAC